jgi:hypothetical protein
MKPHHFSGAEAGTGPASGFSGSKRSTEIFFKKLTETE